MRRKTPFESELILHSITQKRLDIFSLEFVASEIQLKKQRFDTLAFDRKSNSFVIIEYKNEFNRNVLNQCLKYYELLLDNRDVYVSRLNEVFDTDKSDFDFESTRVMIIGPEFSEKQIRESSNYPFELWKATLYDSNEIVYERLPTGEKRCIKVSPKELTLTEEDFLKGKSEDIYNLYHKLKKRIYSEFDDVYEVILVDGVAYKVNGKIICVSNIRKAIKIRFHTDELNDRENKTRDISGITTGGKSSHYEFTLDSEDDVDYAVDLFKQVYKQKRNYDGR